MLVVWFLDLDIVVMLVAVAILAKCLFLEGDKDSAAGIGICESNAPGSNTISLQE